MIVVGGGEIHTKLKCLKCGWVLEVKMSLSQFVREAKKNGFDC